MCLCTALDPTQWSCTAPSGLTPYPWAHPTAPALLDVLGSPLRPVGLIFLHRLGQDLAAAKAASPKRSMRKKQTALFAELRQAPHANSLLSQSMGLWFPNLRMLSGSSIGLPLALYVCPYSRVTVMPYATWTTFILSRFFFFCKSQCSSGKAWIPLAFKICFALLTHGAVGKVALERWGKTERYTKNLLRYKMSSGCSSLKY